MLHKYVMYACCKGVCAFFFSDSFELNQIDFEKEHIRDIIVHLTLSRCLM